MSKTKSNGATPAQVRTSTDVAHDLAAKRLALEHLKTTAANDQRHYDQAEHRLAEVGVLADAGDADAGAEVPTLESTLDTRQRVWRTNMLKKEILTKQIADLERVLEAVSRQEQLAVIAKKVEAQRAIGAELDTLITGTLVPLLHKYYAAAEAVNVGGFSTWKQVIEGLVGHLLIGVPDLYRHSELRRCVVDVHRQFNFAHWADYNGVRSVRALDPAPAGGPIEADDETVVEQAG